MEVVLFIDIFGNIIPGKINSGKNKSNN